MHDMDLETIDELDIKNAKCLPTSPPRQGLCRLPKYRSRRCIHHRFGQLREGLSH